MNGVAETVRSLVLLLVAGCGVVAGYQLGRADSPIPGALEAAAPEVRHKNGSVTLARTPDPSPPPQKFELPKGQAEERRASVTVTPTNSPCPPVTVDLSWLRTEDGRRLIAHSEQGEVTGYDMPILPDAMDLRRVWAAGVLYGPLNDTWGGWVEKDIWRVRVGLDVFEDQTDRDRSTLGVHLRAGWTFGD